MKIVCPSCGATHSAEAWTSDPDIRQCMVIVADLPRGIAKRVFPYLALFRGNKSLTWAKALRLLTEVRALVTDGMIHWDKNPARPNSLQAWELAMEQIIETPPKRLPLKSHGYLTSIAYERADMMDRKSEQLQNKKIVAGAHRENRDQSNLKPFSMPLSSMREIRKQNMNKPGKNS